HTLRFSRQNKGNDQGRREGNEIDVRDSSRSSEQKKTNEEHNKVKSPPSLSASIGDRVHTHFPLRHEAASARASRVGWSKPKRKVPLHALPPRVMGGWGACNGVWVRRLAGWMLTLIWDVGAGGQAIGACVRVRVFAGPVRAARAVRPDREVEKSASASTLQAAAALCLAAAQRGGLGINFTHV
ncbi:hypothetical protein B0H12DRAFT_1156330, partial [Mycena haematopus]